MTMGQINELIQDNLETRAKLKAKLATLPEGEDARRIKRKIAKCNRINKELNMGKLILSFQRFDIPRL